MTDIILINLGYVIFVLGSVALIKACFWGKGSNDKRSI